MPSISPEPIPTYAVQDWTSQLSGCSGMSGNWPGVAYDSVLDRIVEWPGSGNTVYLFDSVTKTCVPQTFAGGPQAGSGINNGTFGRFRYFPELNAYVIVNDPELDAQALAFGYDFAGVGGRRRRLLFPVRGYLLLAIPGVWPRSPRMLKASSGRQPSRWYPTQPSLPSLLALRRANRQ